MFNKKIHSALIGGAVALGMTLSGAAMAAFTADEATTLVADSLLTLAKFQEDTKGEEGVFANAKGILVCPKITKVGVIIGIEGGKCVLTVGDGDPIFYQSTGLKAGAIVGASTHSMILVINSDEALAKFTEGKREWEVGVDASFAVAQVAAGGDIDTTNLKKSVVAFIFGEKGLIGDLSIEGSNFKKLDVE